ncbi:DEAD-box ATP-dependent RNA helicase 31 [Lathyrus oleraceus]|uniref:ATP-dependent RNA helicase n=1 Tax=Pisum sativum TaxID=3888 RepID=A0A9D4WRA3_PEA|nr:DEAD-box ATP-dependent RNA helicase 31 [Pisum sativum]
MHRTKLEPRGRKCVFLGYKNGMKGVVLYDINSHTVLVSRNVIHHEHIFPYSNAKSTNWNYHPYKYPIDSPQHDPIILAPSQSIESTIEEHDHHPNITIDTLHHSNIDPESLENADENHDIQSIPDTSNIENDNIQSMPVRAKRTPHYLSDYVCNTSNASAIYDEADHLLDMGFRKDIEKIFAAIPKQRQTLMFSAIIPDEVRQVCHIAMKRDFEYINTVQEGSEDTHSQVRQMHLVAPLDNHFPLLYVILKEHIADDVDYKKSIQESLRVSDEFRKSKGLILVTSDVSARGVDYPDVTLVVQVGLPADREQYIHRLGRTGRRGKEGQGILLLAPWEEFFLATAKDLPIGKAPVPSVDPDTKKKVERALSNVEMKNKEAAYQAWLGYYNSNKKVGKDKYRLVELANEFSRCMGLDSPPAIPKLVLGKMGLKYIPGLRSK